MSLLEIDWKGIPTDHIMRFNGDIKDCAEFPKNLSTQEKTQYYRYHILLNTSQFPVDLILYITSFIANLYCIGDLIDCQDPVHKWCTCRIVDIVENKKIRIHYEGWSAKWDEWLPLDSDRLAPIGTYTKGYVTAPRAPVRKIKLKEETGDKTETRQEEPSEQKKSWLKSLKSRFTKE